MKRWQECIKVIIHLFVSDSRFFLILFSDVYILILYLSLITILIFFIFLYSSLCFYLRYLFNESSLQYKHSVAKPKKNLNIHITTIIVAILREGEEGRRGVTGIRNPSSG